MKKKLIILFIFFLFPFFSAKADTLYKVGMDIDIQKNGDANITEKWDVQGNSGTEWYKQLIDMGNMQLSNYKVYMDGKELTKKDYWDLDASLSEKSGYYGINYINDGLELCFGKGDYSRHTFTINYTLSNFVFNTSDAQVVYFNAFPRVYANSFYVNVKSYYTFPDTLDVWGYGYMGYAYVKDGIIQMSEGEDLNNEYVVLLAKFPLDTFETTNSYSQFSSFDEILNDAEEGTTGKYEGGNSSSIELFVILLTIIQYLFWPVLIIIGIKSASKGTNRIMVKFDDSKDGKLDKDIPNFRDIPCNKDLFRAYFIANQYKMNIKKEDLLGAILLKWIKDGNAEVEKVTTKNLIGKEKTESNIIFKSSPVGLEEEVKLYAWMQAAAGDNKLESGEFKSWCKRNYTKILDWYNLVLEGERDLLVEEGMITKDVPTKIFKSITYKGDHRLKEEAQQLAGLKNFLVEFSKIDEREPIEVKLWNEYLIFAQMFGIADKVAKQFEKLYPEIKEYMDQTGYNSDTYVFINNISYTGMSSANSARRAAEAAANSYSGGGGGFSSGGGGGGSFGGGGGGSMGGR